MFHVARMVLAGAAVVLAGCRGGHVSFSFAEHHDPPPRVVRRAVHVRHVCTRDCHGHYWNGTRLVVLERHRHGPDCGHVWNGTYWVAAVDTHARTAVRIRPHKPAVRKTTVVRHVHGPRCGHVYHRRLHKWVAVRKGHVHGPHCGHVLIEGRWTIHD